MDIAQLEQNSHFTPIYKHAQEVWNETQCARVAKKKVPNHPYPGRVACASSSYPEYGQIVRFNGGTVRDGEWYQSEYVPLPKIPDTYEFFNRVSWGTYLRKKA